jgi:methylglutamate dehydrogenase subunit D
VTEAAVHSSGAVSGHPGAASALAGHLHKGRHGTTLGNAGVTVLERTGVAVSGIAVRVGQAQALTAKIKARTGLELPSNPKIVASGHLSFVWAGPGQWLAQADGEDGAAFAADLARDLAGLASVTDQSDGRFTLKVSGLKIRDTLAKGCMLDLHDKVFKVGDTAVTPVALLNVQITRLPNVDGAAVFELAVMRSLAISLWHWFELSAAEFGIDVI